jgi:hypothetical protein
VPSVMRTVNTRTAGFLMCNNWKRVFSKSTVE